MFTHNACFDSITGEQSWTCSAVISAVTRILSNPTPKLTETHYQQTITVTLRIDISNKCSHCITYRA